MTEQWLSIVEYSRAHAISDMTIRRHIKSGKIPAVLRDGKYFIPASPVHARTMKQEESTNTNTAHVKRGQIETSPRQEHGQTFHPQDFGHIPSHIASTMRDSHPVTLEAKNLLDFCERAMKSNSTLIQTLEDKFSAREKSFATELKLKDQEIIRLQQTVEDLQVLAKMLERR